MSNRTFKPTIKEDGSILAGGMKLGQVVETEWVFDDRFLRRCQARGTDNVSVTLYDIVELLLEHVEGLDR